MIYEIKNILKSRFSIVCFVILFMANIIGSLNVLGNIEHQSNQDMYTVVSTKILQKKDLLKVNKSTYNNQITKLSKDEKNNWENYLEYNKWEIDAYEKIRDCYKEDRVNNEEFNELNFLLTLTDMSIYTDENHHDYGYDVTFKDDKTYIDNLMKKHNIEFDILLLGKLNDGFVSDEKHVHYTDRLKRAEDILFRLKTGQKQLFLGSNSPWSYLVNQLDDESLFSFIVLPLGMIFSIVSMRQSIRNRSINLITVQPFSKFKIAMKKVLSIYLSYIIIIVLSLFIPMIIVGIKFGWSGFSSTILTDLKGYCSLSSYEFDPTLKAGYGLSKYYGIPNDSFLIKDAYISERLQFVSMIMVLGLSLMMLFLLIYIYIILGVGIILFVKCNIIQYCLIGSITAFYFLSRFYNLLNYECNIFSYPSCMRMAVGGMQTSQLMVLVYITIYIVGSLIFIWKLQDKEVEL